MEIEKYIVATDSELVDMVLAGDSRAFECLFERYGASLRQLYFQRTGGKSDDTDDLIQEIFIKAFLNLSSYNRRYTFGQWIYTIAKNTFIDYVRKKRDDVPFEASKGEFVRQPASLTPNPEENIIREQRQTQLELYLDMMTPKYRKLIELRYFKDLSYDEISEELGLPMGTIKTQIHRARTQLSEFINERGI